MNTENDRFANHNRQIPQEDTIDLLELVFAILSRWKLLICITVLCAAAAGAYNWFCLEPLYQASSKIYISSTNTVINIQELQLSDELTVDYEEIIRSRTVLKKVIAKLNLNMTYEDLDRMISISNPKDSHCLNIAVTCSDPNMAVTITNSLVTIGIDQVYRVIGHDEPAIIDPAEVDAVKDVKDSLLKYTVLGGMLGAVSVCGLVVIQVLADNAYTYGDGGKVSCTNLVEAVSQLLGGVPIHEYVVTNNGSIAELNELIGGVTVVVPNNDLVQMYSELSSGSTVQLDAHNVEDFVRWRDTAIPFSNNGRMERQQAFSCGFFRMFREQVISQPEEMWSKIQSREACMQTSITKSQYLNLVSFLQEETFSDADYYFLKGEDVQGAEFEELHLNPQQKMQTILQLFYLEDEEGAA